MKTLRLPVLLALTFCLGPALFADTITLKSGEKIEGKVVKEEGEQLTIEYKVSASITDLRNVAKGDVDKVVKETPEESDFLALKVPLKLGADSLPPESYDAALKQLEAYIAKYPESAHAKDLTPVVTSLKEEKGRVQAGELKLAGNWISKEEVQKEAYQLGGRVLLAQMKEQARRSDQVAALNTFDQLERRFPGAAAYPDAIDAAKPILTTLKQKADRALETWRYQKKELDDATKLTAEPKRSELLALQKQEQARFDAAVDAAARAGIKWPPFVSRNEKTLVTISQKVPTEISRLDGLAVAKMRTSIKAIEKARAAIAAKDFEGASAALGEASNTWSVNELTARVDKELAEAKALVAAAATAEPPPEAIAAKTDAAPAATPSAGGSAAATGNTAATPDTAPAEEEHKPLLKTPLGMGLTAVVLIVLILVFLQQLRARRAAEEAAIHAEEEERAREIDEHFRNPTAHLHEHQTEESQDT